MENPNINEKVLLTYGYTKHKLSDTCKKALFQKRVKDSDGTTLYFIDCFYYEFPDHIAFSFESHFYRLNKDSVTINYNTDNTSLTEIETFFHNMFRAGGFDFIPDPYNND